MTRFLDWWLDALASLMPARWQNTRPVPPGWLVFRSFRLPAAAKENLAGAIAAELDRVTPFTPEQVYLMWQAGPVQGREIPIDLAVVPRRLADPLRAEGVARLVAPDGAPDWLTGLNFLPRGALGGRPALSRPVVLVLLLALSLPSAASYWRGQHLQSRLAEVQREAAQTLVLSREVASRRAGLSPLDIERASRPSVSLLLADLTRALPDGAYLDGLAIDGQSLSLSGYASSAAAVIPALAQSGRFSDVHFTGGVTREPERGLERFQISALYGGAS
jgi:general secretion pathway protein L